MTGLHDPRLVALSVLIAVLTGFAALNLVQRVALSRRIAARSWLTFGALLMGAGVWAMQFVLLQAYELPIVVVYHVPTMLFALGVSVLMSFFALWVASAPRMGALRLGIAGLCMGLGLVVMYYAGVFAMQIVPAVFHEPKPFAVSVMVAVCAAWLVLGLGSLLRAGVSMSVLLARAAAGSVAGMALWIHQYTSMTAARFTGDSYSLGAGIGQDGEHVNGLLILVAVASALGVFAVMLLTVIDHARREAAAAPHLDESDALLRDPVTGLANQHLLQRRFDELLDTVTQAGQLFALLRLDASPVKPAPDAELAAAEPAAAPAIETSATPTAEIPPDADAPWQREVAQRLATLIRPGDTVARCADGQFVLLLAGLTDSEIPTRVAARVREEISKPVELPEGALQLQPRIGISLYPRDGGDLDTLRRIAGLHQQQDA